MAKWRVSVPFPVWVIVEVEADDKEQAEDKAIDKAGLTAFVGNGGFDKMVGVSDPSMSVEAGDCYIDTPGFQIDVEEI